MKQWTKEQEIALINQTQDEYVQELIDILNSNDPSIRALEEVNFTSPTGTGKTKMMAKIINRMPNDYFIVTTLSKGQLHKQVSKAIEEDCTDQNFRVYGVQSYTKNSILQDDDILAEIKALPSDARVFWFRDEGHIKSNKWMKLLQKRCYKIVNWSATNHDAFGVKCNFTHTMMLRTVQQTPGDIDMALDKLVEIKKQHRCVPGYNPCAVVRLTSTALLETVTKACKKRKLSYISLLQNDDYDMSELCEDDCEYDVIINQQKIVEGIDIRRAHVLWMENEPAKAATTIQMIGRCRRNALLWRDDIDICLPENKELLEQTRQCFAFYNEKNMHIDEDESGELAQEFCPIISVEKLKTGSTIQVTNGVMSNGLSVAELEGCTGEYTIQKDPETGFNIVDNPKFYATVRSITSLLCNKKDPYVWLNELNVFVQTHPTWSENVQREIDQHLRNGEFLSVTYESQSGDIVRTARQYIIDDTGCFITSQDVIPIDQYHGVQLALQYAPTCYLHTSPRYDTTQYDKENGYIFLNINQQKYKIYFSELHQLIQKGAITIEDLDVRRFQDLTYIPQIVEVNNSVLAQLGPETWHLMRHHIRGSLGIPGSDNYLWEPDIAVTNRVKTFSKLVRFLRQYYKKEYESAMQQIFTQKQNFAFPKNVNKALGFLVEHYAKSLIYGPAYLSSYYQIAIKEKYGTYNVCNIDPSLEPLIRIRACLMKYRDEIKTAYALQSARFLPAFSIDTLSKKEYQTFVETIQTLGQSTANWLQQYTQPGDEIYRPIIQTQFLSGLMDVITKESIIDIKCTGAITEYMILQVLAYSYLAQYISNVHIKQAIIYDAVTQRSVIIPITTPPHNAEITSQQNVLIKKYNDAATDIAATDITPDVSKSVIDETYNGVQLAAAIRATQGIQPEIDAFIFKSLHAITFDELLQNYGIRSDIINIITTTFTTPQEMYQRLYMQHEKITGIGDATLSTLRNACIAHSPSYLWITNTLTPIQTKILQVISTKIFRIRLNNEELYTHVCKHFRQYETAWMHLIQYAREHNCTWISFPARMHLQIHPTIYDCEYWDDEYIAL